MADPVAVVERIVKLGLRIKDAVETVRHNEQECGEITSLVHRFSAILTELQEAGMISESPATCGALDDLEETLERALKLVAACQQKSTIRRFFASGDLSKQLCRVKDDMLKKVMLAQFAMITQTTIVLRTMQVQAAGGHSRPGQREDAGLEIWEHHVGLLREFRWSELKAATNGFSSHNVICEGGSFIVYKGKLNDGNIVAIKRAKHFADGPYSNERKLFLLEKYQQIVPAFSKLQHKNIVKAVGQYHHYEVLPIAMRVAQMGGPKEREFIWVEEYVPNGSLNEIICGSRSRRLDWSSLFQIIKGIAEGIQYLHDQGIVHMDLKPGNILLDSDFNPKITDFDISVVLNDEDKIVEGTHFRGTMGYIAPENFMNGTMSRKNDVYAFGRTLLQIIRSMFTEPYSSSRSKGNDNGGDDRHILHSVLQWARNACKDDRIADVMDPSLFDRSQLTQIKRCVHIALLCDESEPAARPTMMDIFEMLHSEEYLPIPKKSSFIE